MALIQLPPMAWNCHMHCFNPEVHPFKPNRSYTPEPAKLQAFLDNTISDNAVMVQATIEDGPAGLLDHLLQARDLDPSKRVMGTVVWDPEPTAGLKNMSADGYDRLHDAGVRAVRVHGSYGGSGDDAGWVRDQFLDVAQHVPARLGWAISAQLPLAIWAALAETILTHPALVNFTFVADHNGSARPADVGSADMAGFLKLIASGRVYVKVGALHRRSPGNIEGMKPVVQAFAQASTDTLLWGSDWPHVNTTAGGLSPTPPLAGVDTNAELAALKEWLTEEQWKSMLVSNPARLFGTRDK